MKIRKKYTHDNKRQIFRLIPTGTNKLIIEERDTEKKQAYFNCLQIENGKEIFNSLQLKEKFWLGIETVHKDIVFFHKFAKPDLPQHLGITAFDINNAKTIWEDPNRTFLFIKDDTVFTFQQGFEGRKFEVLDSMTGKVIAEPDYDSDTINLMREKVDASRDYSSYNFPERFEPFNMQNQVAVNYLNGVKKAHNILGEIEFVLVDSLLMFNFHEKNKHNSIDNIFKAIDLMTGKHILEITLNSQTNAFAPDSFFVKDNLLFILIEKTKLKVYKISI